MRAAERVRMQLAVLGHGLSRTAEVLPIALILMALIVLGPFAVWWALDAICAVLRGLL